MNKRWFAVGLCSVLLAGCATDPHTGETRPLGKVVGVDRPGRAMRLALEEAGIEVQRSSENTLDLDIPFASGSSRLTPQVQDTLNSVASVLNQYPKSTVTVTGHADDIGTDRANQRLSEQRARSVANYLISNGVDAGRISQKGMGEQMVKSATADEVSRAEQRRVDLTIVTHQDMSSQSSGRSPTDGPAAPRTYPPSGGK
jgi:outer membrane protein OmpA-like peptidoglycan-associated protein